MKMFKWKWAVALWVAVTLSFGAMAQANHVPMVLTEGETVVIPQRASYCMTKGTAVSVIEEFAANGRKASVDLFNIYFGIGECANLAGVIITVVDLVTRFENAGAVEVEMKKNDGTTQTAYMVIANLDYKEALGDPV